MAVETRPSPIRRGVCKYLTLDHDVLPLLEELAPGPRSRGRFISALIRAEAIRLEGLAECDRLRLELAQARAERLLKPAMHAEAERACG